MSRDKGFHMFIVVSFPMFLQKKEASFTLIQVVGCFLSGSPRIL